MKFRFENEKMRLTVTSLQCKCQIWSVIDQGNLIKSKPIISQKTNEKETTIELVRMASGSQKLSSADGTRSSADGQWSFAPAVVCG